MTMNFLDPNNPHDRIAMLEAEVNDRRIRDLRALVETNDGCLYKLVQAMDLVEAGKPHAWTRIRVTWISIASDSFEFGLNGHHWDIEYVLDARASLTAEAAELAEMVLKQLRAT